jgi:phosphate acyltransferase
MEEIRLAIDVESGDFGPEVVISGVLEARKISQVPFTALLCGNQENIDTVLRKTDISKSEFEIVHCTDTISLSDKRASVWKNRTDSSIVRCISLQKEGRADVSVSAGDTAILMGAAIFILGRCENVLRPALAAFIPTTKKKPVLLLDVGANLNCRAEHLVSFAEMGMAYFCRYLGISSPTIGLLNIGKEAVKGTDIVCNAGEILHKKYKEYTGFVEGNGIISGEADIIVCDGFMGNVLLKAFEQFHVLIKSVIGNSSELFDQLKGKLTSLDPEVYGGVPLLGIDGAVFKAHGGSSARAIAHAVCAAVKAAKRSSL